MSNDIVSGAFYHGHSYATPKAHKALCVVAPPSFAPSSQIGIELPSGIR
jgi:hypothetical protein